MEEKTNYVSMEFDVKQMIRLLGNDMYDTPLAMLRENVQNAYDAILERRIKDKEFVPKIDIEITSTKVTITDNGIGMNGDILANNYWKAGHSGKNTPEAQQAGVVGHFGIGALANFGVCTDLMIQTHRYGECVCYESEAHTNTLNKRDSIKITEIANETGKFGTKVTITLEHSGSISENQARSYLKPYIEYLEIPVFINGIQCVQKKIEFVKQIQGFSVNYNNIAFKLDVGYQTSQTISNVNIFIYDIVYYGKQLEGFIFLNDERRTIMGLRNRFGLATISVNSVYGLGGVANLNNLIPTAGREAISRESVSMVNQIITAVERQWTAIIAKNPMCDGYREFLSYINTYYDEKLVGNIKIKKYNEETFVRLNQITEENIKSYQYANNVDNSILNKYNSSQKTILVTSDNTLRRNIQLKYLRQKGVEQISNNVQLLRTYDNNDIEVAQYFVLSEIKSILQEDYYVRGFEVKLADISHGVTILVLPLEKNSSFGIYISPDNPELKHMMDVKAQDYKLFTPLVKDFVRLALYPQFASYMPKDARERADYISKVLHNSKEELEIQYEQMGSMEDMIGKLRRNEISEEEFAKFAKAERNKHQQTINTNQVGYVADIVQMAHNNSMNEMTKKQHQQVDSEYIPMPPILSLESETSKMLLKAQEPSAILNGHMMFMALSNKMVNQKRIFFTSPHTTRVIWSMRKLIYLFTDASGKNTLYYDMELARKIPNNSTGGKTIKTTTILTKDKIFVPIIAELYEYFDIKADQKLKFFVHFDELENL